MGFACVSSAAVEVLQYLGPLLKKQLYFFSQDQIGFLWDSRIHFCYQSLYSLQFSLSQDIYVWTLILF